MEIGLVVMDENPADALTAPPLRWLAAGCSPSAPRDLARRRDSAGLKPAHGAWFRLRQKKLPARCITDHAG